MIRIAGAGVPMKVARRAGSVRRRDDSRRRSRGGGRRDQVGRDIERCEDDSGGKPPSRAISPLPGRDARPIVRGRSGPHCRGEQGARRQPAGTRRAARRWSRPDRGTERRDRARARQQSDEQPAAPGSASALAVAPVRMTSSDRATPAPAAEQHRPAPRPRHGARATRARCRPGRRSASQSSSAPTGT